MLDGADAGDALRRLVGIGLEPGDQRLEVARRHALPRGHQQRAVREQRDGLEVGEEIVGKRVERADQHVRRQGAGDQRVAVG